MSDMVVYDNGEIALDISVEQESIWLKAESISVLFSVNRPAIVKHIGNIYKTEELQESSTCSILEQVASLPSLLRGSVYGSFIFNLTRNFTMHKVFAFSEIDRGMLRWDDE